MQSKVLEYLIFVFVLRFWGGLDKPLVTATISLEVLKSTCGGKIFLSNAINITNSNGSLKIKCAP